ncbi:hypothetical protein SAY87_011490 [Trapa incisa]|uniref:RRM domain-containing protein n=1 Tax=Trapa incisa TaxID=236973 RepID=A0AAN7JJ94_9MYRT|nr:hypothetical protein SAY87_011490 [Trapa incisa]
MADAYWNRQQQQAQQVPPPGALKRPRLDYEVVPPGMLSGPDTQNYPARDDDRGRIHVVKDTKTIMSAYDRYLQATQMSSLNSGEVGSFGGGTGSVVGGGSGLARSGPGVMPSLSVADQTAMAHPGHLVPDLAPNSRNSGFGGQRPVDIMSMPGQEPVHLPPNATSTLFVEGLPADCTQREVAHIFRPFVGYKEVRLVTKESKHRGGDPLMFCFVDFANPACAATAMGALQGYKMDEHDSDSACLRLQFARNPRPLRR